MVDLGWNLDCSESESESESEGASVIIIEHKISLQQEIQEPKLSKTLVNYTESGRSFFCSGWHYGGEFSCRGVFFLVLTLGNVCESVP